MKRLNIAMLAEQEVQVEEQVEQAQAQTELEVVGEQAEDAMAEAAQVQAEIEVTQQAADEAEEVVQEVEEERQVLEQTQEQGGAEPVAMESLQRAIKRFEKRTGVPCAINSMGLESFSSKSTRLQSTKIAMEGAVEYIKKLVKMLMDAMAAVWEKVKAFFEKLMVGADRLAKRAKQLEAAAKAAQGKTAAADAVVTTGSVVAFARMDGKAVEGKDFADQYIKQTSESHESSKKLAETLDAFIKGDKVVKLIEQSKTKDSEAALLEMIVADAPTTGVEKAEEGMVEYKAGESLLGDYALHLGAAFDKTATWEQVTKGYYKIKASVARADDFSADAVKEVKPLTTEDAKRVAYQVAGHMSSYQGLAEEQKKFGDEIKKIVTEAKALEKEKDASVDQIRVATGYVRAMSNRTMSLLVSMRAYDVNLAKAALDYVAASLKAANGKAAEATGTEVAVA